MREGLQGRRLGARAILFAGAATAAGCLAAATAGAGPQAPAPAALGAASFPTEWIDAEPVPTPRQEVAVAELDGLIYVIGGFGKFGAIVGTVEVYDPSADDWTEAAPLPTPTHHAAAASSGGKLYVIGGWSDFFVTELDTVYEYDPGTNEWTEKAPLSAPRGSPAAAAADGLIYVAGGSPNARAGDFAVYDPEADEWTPLPDLPTPRNHLGAAVLDGRIYFAAGREGSLGPEVNTGAADAFDPVLGEWVSVSDVPTPRSGVAVAAAAGRLFVFGGEGNRDRPDGIFDDVEAYDPKLRSWETLPVMPTGRHGIGAAAVDGRIYIPGGGPIEGFGTTDVHEVLIVPEPPAGWQAAATLAALAARRRQSRRHGQRV